MIEDPKIIHLSNDYDTNDMKIILSLSSIERFNINTQLNIKCNEYDENIDFEEIKLNNKYIINFGIAKTKISGQSNCELEFIVSLGDSVETIAIKRNVK